MDQAHSPTKASTATAMLLRKRLRRANNKAKPARHKPAPKGDSNQITNFDTTIAKAEAGQAAAINPCSRINHQPSKIPSPSANRSSHSAERVGVNDCKISISAP